MQKAFRRIQEKKEANGLKRRFEKWHHKKTEEDKRDWVWHWIWRDKKGRFTKKDISILSEALQKQFKRCRILGQEASSEVFSEPILRQSKARQRQFKKFVEAGHTPEVMVKQHRRAWKTRREKYGKTGKEVKMTGLVYS